MSEVPAGSKVIKRTDNKDFGFTDLKFANGVHMILKSTDFKNDEILFSAYSPGGISLYPDADVMSATVAPTIITQSGLGDYDFTGLQKKLSGNTAKLTPYINDLREGVNGSCSPKDLETMLQLNYLYFTRIRRDENAFNSYVSRIKNMIKPLRAMPQMIFSDTLSKIISQNSPRVITLPSEAQLNQISLDRSIAIFKDRFADASDFTYLMVGNYKIDEVIPMLEKYIGGLPSIKRKETWKDQTPRFPKGLLIVDVPKNSEPQSTVAMVWEGDFKWNAEDCQGFTMLMNILAIKCRESMREDQGGVYGVSISGTTSKLPESKYSVTATWGCNPENIKKLSQTVLDEMGKIKKDNGFWLSALQNHFYYGDIMLSLQDYETFVNSFSANSIKGLANKYLNTNSYVQVDLTPAPKTETK